MLSFMPICTDWSLFLTKSRSLVNKMDEIQLRIMSRHIETCVTVITETWLDNNIPDAAIG